MRKVILHAAMSDLRLFNTLSREKETFIPLRPDVQQRLFQDGQAAGRSRLAGLRALLADGDEATRLFAEALEDGRLDPDRLASWRKLKRELAFEARRDDPAAQREARDRWKRIHKAARARRRFEEG